MLVRAGFRGPIYCTSGTADLVRILWSDAAMAEEEAERASGPRSTTDHRGPPLFTREDVARAIDRLTVKHRYEPFAVAPAGMTATFRRAGHVIGASAVDLELRDGAEVIRLVYAGALGHDQHPILVPPTTVPRADVLLVESPCRDRVHPVGAIEELAAAITSTAGRGGRIIIPAFAVGRVQDLLWCLRRLEVTGRIPAVPVVLDGPTAVDAPAIFRRHPDDHTLALAALGTEHDPLAPSTLRFALTSDDSRALTDVAGPLILIASTAMASGGRALQHLRRGLPDARNTVVLVGHQAVGTLGRALADGVPTVRVLGDDVPVRADVVTVDGLGARADREALLRWLDGFEVPPSVTWVVGGEPAVSSALAETVARRPGWHAAVAVDGATVPLVAGVTPLRSRAEARCEIERDVELVLDVDRVDGCQ